MTLPQVDGQHIRGGEAFAAPQQEHAVDRRQRLQPGIACIHAQPQQLHRLLGGQLCPFAVPHPIAERHQAAPILQYPRPSRVSAACATGDGFRRNADLGLQEGAFRQ